MAKRPAIQGGGVFCIDLVDMAELNLWLDSYDDIYSDFDSSHYLKRRISEDFLYELRTEMKYNEHYSGDMVCCCLRSEGMNRRKKLSQTA